MAAHHDNNHTNEKKPVAFTVPFILATVTIAVILTLVSLGDPCVCDETCSAECIEKCEDPHGKKHGGTHATEGTDEHGGSKADEAKPAEEHGKQGGDEAQKPEGH